MYLKPGSSGSALGWPGPGPAPRSPSPEMTASVNVGVRRKVWKYGAPPLSGGPPVQVPVLPGVAESVLDVPAHDALLLGLRERPDADVRQMRGRVQEADAARPVVQDVDLPSEQLRICVRQHPLDAVHGVELGMSGVREEAVVVLLRVEEVLHVAIPEDLADPVDVLRAGGEPVRDRPGHGVDEVAECAERDRLPEKPIVFMPSVCRKANRVSPARAVEIRRFA